MDTTIRSMVVHVSDSPRAPQVLALALRLAELHGARLSAIHAVAPSASGAYISPEASSLAVQLRGDTDKARQQRAADLVTAAGGEIAFASVMSDAASEMVQAARSSDLLVMGQQESGQQHGLPEGLVGRLLVSAACPILFVPYVHETPRCGERVLVAWRDSRESARALRDALPLLRRAQRVELVRFAESELAGPEPLLRAQAYLRLHGVEAELKVLQRSEPSLGERLISPWTPDASVAEALLSQAADSDADLIVMGGFGHTRLWELVLGGVTRTMLESMTVPVLMSH